MSKMNSQSVPRLPNGGIDAAALYDAALVKFTADLATNRFWDLFPKAGGASDGVLDAQTGLRYPPVREMEDFLEAHAFLYVQDQSGQYQATLHTATGQLWVYLYQDSSLSLKNAETKVAESRSAGLSGWRLPTKDELHSFATAFGNPHREGRNYRLHGAWYWLTTQGRCEVGEGCWGVSNQDKGRVFATNDYWGSTSNEQMTDLVKKGWQLTSPDGKVRFPATISKRWQGFNPSEMLNAVVAYELRSLEFGIGFFGRIFSKWF